MSVIFSDNEKVWPKPLYLKINIGQHDLSTPRKYWLITQEAMAPSRHDWKIVDWDVKPQHNQPTNQHDLYFMV